MRKIALVTGGNSGIGYATARLLKQKEYEVFISGRNKERLEQAAGELGVDFFLADMSEPEDIKRLASNFSESGLDVLVNNAAIGGMIPLDYFTWEVFSKIFNTNVNGPLLLIKELLSALEKRGGSITTVSSISADIGASYLFLYASSKGAVNAFTRGLAVELAPRGIRVNAVAPGYVDTPMFEKVGLRPEQITELKKEVRDGNPLGRFGTPEEVGQVIVAQVEATYVTGSIWIVDGGLSISRGR